MTMETLEDVLGASSFGAAEFRAKDTWQRGLAWPLTSGATESVGRNQLPSELQHAFEEAIAKYNRWQSGDEPTVSYQMQNRSISSICNLMTFYENAPLRPGIMELLIAVADERHADLKNDLENNYASAGQYLLRLIEYRKEWHQRRVP